MTAIHFPVNILILLMNPIPPFMTTNKNKILIFLPQKNQPLICDGVLNFSHQLPCAVVFFFPLCAEISTVTRSQVWISLTKGKYCDT